MKGLLFTYALTYGGAAVALVNPFYGLLVYIIFAILRPESLWSWSVPVGNYSQIVAIAMLIGWAFQGFGKWNFRAAKPIVFCLLGYMAWLCVSALFAGNQDVAWDFVDRQSKIVLPFVVGATLIDSTKRLKQLLWVVLLSEAWLAIELNRNYFAGAYPIAAEIRFSFYDNNGLGIMFATSTGLAFFFGLQEKVWWRKWGLFAVAALMAHIPMFCMSRGGMLGVLVVGAVAFLLIPKKPRDYALFALAVAVALRLAGHEVQKRFFTVTASEENRDESAESRVLLWRAAWGVMLAKPLVGLGPAQWQLHAHEYGFPRGKALHSTWMSTGSELGFPGLAFLLGFYAAAMWLLWKRIRFWDRSDPFFAHVARMAIASITGFLVSASFVSVEGVELPYYVVLMGVGALLLSPEHQAATAAVRPSPVLGPAAALSSPG